VVRWLVLCLCIYVMWDETIVGHEEVIVHTIMQNSRTMYLC
jgi:hypothetical protein